MLLFDWNSIRNLLDRRSIFLDKCPGVCSIGNGEVLRNLCAKAKAMATGEDVQQLCVAD